MEAHVNLSDGRSVAPVQRSLAVRSDRPLVLKLFFFRLNRWLVLLAQRARTAQPSNALGASSAWSQLRTPALRRPESAVAEIADVGSCLQLRSPSLEPRHKKSKSQGGYPTPAHGGLTLLEVAIPWIETSKPSTGKAITYLLSLSA